MRSHGLPQMPSDPERRAEFWREWPRLAREWGYDEIEAARVYELCKDLPTLRGHIVVP